MAHLGEYISNVYRERGYPKSPQQHKLKFFMKRFQKPYIRIGVKMAGGGGHSKVHMASIG